MKKEIKHKGDFPKGHIPWNKNKKGYMGANKTSFKKGHMPTKGFTIGFTPWNKDKKTGLVPKSAFKKGQLSPNKGKKRPNISGENSPHWQGGITTENHKIRTSLEMKLFRKACMERDNFTDQKTGQRGGRLVVHHINNFADFRELRTSIENGITLSVESHRAFHKKYGKRNNTKEQLLEFLNN